jgi:hypothetical protein
MVFDYAKIGTVVKDSKGMFRETLKAFRFVFGNFFSAFGLYLLIALVGGLVFLALNFLRWSVNQSAMGGVLLAFFLGQIAMAGRMWTRVVFYAAETYLYKKQATISPAKMVSVEPPLEFARAEATEEEIIPVVRDNENQPRRNEEHEGII